VLYIWVGPAPLFVANAVSFLCSFAAIWSARSLSVRRSGPSREGFLQALQGGFRVAGSYPPVVALLVLTGAAALVWRVLEISLVAMVQAPLGLGQQGFGRVFALMNVSTAIGVLPVVLGLDPLMAWVGARGALAVAGVLILVVAALCGLVLARRRAPGVAEPAA
jgi:hypothetical protein